MFTGWQSLPGNVQYDFGGESGSSYTAAWKIPATLTNVNICKSLASFRDRFQMVNYPYKSKIEHAYYPDLTIYKSSIRGLDSYKQNTDSPVTDSTSGLNVLQNVGFYIATFEWRQKPWNPFKLKHARVTRSMEASFEEVPGSVMEGHPKNGGTKKALTTGFPRVAKNQEFQIVYDWVPETMFDAEFLIDLQGKINSDDALLGRSKGQILYLNSEYEPSIDSLGDRGYRVTHNFSAKTRDFNLIDMAPPPGVVSSRTAPEAWVVMKDMANNESYRAYEYTIMKTASKLFYYGWEA
jgi:hypothetical protein